MANRDLNLRRWQKFKANRRAYYSLWIFLILFTLSLFAEFIANDKPVLIYYKSEFYTPIFKDYMETEFGGEFETSAIYTDPYVSDLIEASGWMIWPIIRYSFNSRNYNTPTAAPSPPSSENWLGTDDQARDVVARSIYGFRISVLFALALTIGSSVVGIFAGAIQGYYGGKIDLFGQRLLEIWSGLPTLYLLIILSSIIKPSFLILLTLMLLFSWTTLVDLVRAEFLRGRNLEYVRAARALGVSDLAIMFRHILPNAIVATMTFIPFILAGAVTTLTSLDFLGFGLPIDEPSLGELARQGKENLQAPWLGLTAFVILSSMLILMVFVGEGARDALDPRKENLQ